MSLIDVDSIITVISLHHFDESKDNFDLLIHNLCKEIKEIPIAYDIDKVVEELEKLQKEIFSYAFKYNDDFYNGQASGLEKAIEIVKQGVR